MAEFVRPQTLCLRHPLFPARANVRQGRFEVLFEKSVSLTLGLFITLTFAFALQKALPRGEHLPMLLGALRIQVAHVLVAPPTPAFRPSVEKVVVRTVMANAEAHISPRRLIARWQPYIREASLRFKIPVSWIRAVMVAESGGRTMIDGKPIVSRAGALGLMQLLPETYNDMRTRYRLGTEINDPHDNIIAGAAYLRALHRRYGFPLMFAAYNAGPRQFERDIRAGHDLPAETRAYVRTVVSTVSRARPQDVLSLVPREYAVATRLLEPPA